MELFKSRSHLNPSLIESKVSPGKKLGKPKLCQARVAKACRAGDCLIEPDRAKSRNSRYCRPCARRLKLDRNAAYKRERRSKVGWRAFLFEYSYSSDPEKAEAERKSDHREYMRAYRAWLAFLRATKLSLTGAELRQFRCEFIKAARAILAESLTVSESRRKAVRAGVNSRPILDSMVLSQRGSETVSRLANS